MLGRVLRALLGAGTLTVLVALSGFTPAAYALHTARAYARGVVHMALSKEQKWPKRPDPAGVASAGAQRRTVVFVRHGESTWNEVFNRGFGPTFPLRLVAAAIRELFLIAALDSVFLDAPLSTLGVEQAQALDRFVAGVSKKDNSQMTPRDRMVGSLLGEDAESVVVSSNLRRAMETVAIGLRTRLKGSQEKVLVLSCLQEMARNVDTLALAGAGTVPALPSVAAAVGEPFDATTAFDPSFNVGNKAVGSKGIDRMNEFATWCFSRGETTIIAGGHSLWFRSFFRAFLPYGVEDEMKKSKIPNGGVVGFTLVSGTHAETGEVAYKIEPGSIVRVYGFDDKKSA